MATLLEELHEEIAANPMMREVYERELTRLETVMKTHDAGPADRGGSGGERDGQAGRAHVFNASTSVLGTTTDRKRAFLRWPRPRSTS